MSEETAMAKRKSPEDIRPVHEAYMWRLTPLGAGAFIAAVALLVAMTWCLG
jgi:hypothetical protein